MKFKEQAIRQSTKIVSLPAIYSPRCDKAIFNHLIIKTMIRLNVFVRVSETNREKAIEAAKKLTTCSLKEEGCIAYDTFESSTRHDVFMICETWQNAEVLAEKSPHFGKYVGIIQELAEMKLEKFEF
jgi:quinol monooxygenase YgiN